MRKKLPYLPIGGFPQSKTVKLRLVYQGSLDPGANSYAYETWALNNLEKPKTSTLLIGPPGNHSVWSTQYDKYTVLGARVRLTWTPSIPETGQLDAYPGYLGIYVGRGSTEFNDVVSTSVNHLLEQPNRAKAVFRRLQYSNNTGVSMVMNVSMAKFFKVPKIGLAIGENIFSGASNETSEPEKQCYMFPFVTNIQGNNPDPVEFIMTIDYIVRYSDILPNRAN